jgi:mannose-6-phosphate isomerase-like protein (cupin superfamily)
MNAIARAASYARYHDEPARLEADGVAHWITRAANFVVVTSKVAAGAVLDRTGQADEYMVLLPEDVGATFIATRTNGEPDRIVSPGDTLTIVPPGDSRIEIGGAGYVFRVFSSRADDLAALADNANAYDQDVPDVAALEPWPTPPDGFRLRQYSLPDYVREGNNMRLFRSTNLMINIFAKQTRPRDVTKLTPHHHDDFEQGSLALMGRYVHHFRYPWAADMTQWREDDHGEVGSPSIVIIPPNVIHTTQAIGSDPTRLVDIFAPPRVDFSLKPGLVNNAADYPMPTALTPRAD